MPLLKRPAKTAESGFRLTDRDLEVLVAIYEYRVLTSQLVARLFFSDAEYGERIAQRRLKRLWQHGLVIRREQPQVRSDGSLPYLYLLDTEGADLVSQALGLRREDLKWKPKHRNLSSVFLDHALDVNAVRVSLTVAAARFGFEITQWISDQELRSREMREYVQLKRHGKKQRVAIVPDGYFKLRTESDEYNFFLEVDRGTVTGQSSGDVNRSWHRRIEAYVEYWRSGLYAKRYGTRDFRLLTVVPSRGRLETLCRVTEDAGGLGRYWFAERRLIESGGSLSQRVWTVAGSNARQAILH